MKSKDEFVVGLAKNLKEYINLTGLEWDAVYFRFLAKDDGMCRIELVHTVGLELRTSSSFSSSKYRVDSDLKDKYFDILSMLFFKLYEEIVKEGGGQPAVAVLKVTKTGEYKIDFDYDDRDALQIGKMYLGLPNSYFKPGEIDIPEHILDFQNELGKVK